MSNSKRRRGAKKPPRNDNRLFEQLSKEEQLALLKKRDMERMWQENSAFTRFIGTRGCGGPRRKGK